jgi:hypothetical protein
VDMRDSLRLGDSLSDVGRLGGLIGSSRLGLGLGFGERRGALGDRFGRLRD